MNSIQSLIARHKEKVSARNKACFLAIEQIDRATDELSSSLSPSSFIEPEVETKWKNKYRSLLDSMSEKELGNYKKAARYKILKEKTSTLISDAERLGKRIATQNESVATSLLPYAYSLIGKVEGRRLDEQQMKCIVKTAHNQLVIAGAGTGKTTTIVGKVKYLLTSGACSPQDILILSFTNASASEMKERIEKEVGEGVTVATFHKLGLNIISRVDGVMPRISKLSMSKFIQEQLRSNMKSYSYLRLLGLYLLFNKVASKSEFDFSSPSEYEEYLRSNPPTTLMHETVKSYGEMDIANFLTQNGIRYIYEQPYKFDTRSRYFGQYRPDFYLPDYNIYIEYFGINRSGDVPSYFSGRGSLSASEAYQDSMKWKRSIHRTYGTDMIECYAYEKIEGTLLDNLKEKLSDLDVRFEPIDPSQLWDQLTAADSHILDGVVSLFETVINLIKSNGCTMNDVRSLNKGHRNARGNELMLQLVEPIFDAYNAYLGEHGEIDFNDMIIRATQYVSQGKYSNPYKYVIVDEYQDISKARYSLLLSLRRSNDYTLFCVGDDWQSIYRFAGSDIGFILDFAHYWGATSISKIETTYRFSQSLSEISGDFVMTNPAQIKKKLVGNTKSDEFALGEICGKSDRDAFDLVIKKLDELPQGSTVFFIGRYSFDASALESSSLFCQYNNVSGFVEVEYCRRPDLSMNFVTAHRSKGLQADYVFIINNKNARMGFPSKVQNNAVLDLLLESCDDYPYAEERRLFYVALTRARIKAYIVTVSGKKSEFAMELIKKYKNDMELEFSLCPKCDGRLYKRSGPYGEFGGCSNYRKNGCTYKKSAKGDNDEH